MPEERSVLSPLNGAFFDKEVFKISKGVSTIEHSSKKTNNLLLAIMKFLQSNVGRYATEKYMEKDIDSDEDEISMIFDELDTAVGKNIEQLDVQTKNQISVIEAETRAEQKRAEIEISKKKRILSEETKEKLRQNLIVARAKKEELRQQSEFNKRERILSGKEQGSELPKELNDIEREQILTRKEISKLQKKERKEIYKAKQQEKIERGPVGTSKSQLHTAKRSENGVESDKNGLDYILEDIVDSVFGERDSKEKSKTSKDRVKKHKERLKRSRTKKRGSILSKAGDVFDSAKEKVTSSGAYKKAGDTIAEKTKPAREKIKSVATKAKGVGESVAESGKSSAKKVLSGVGEATKGTLGKAKDIGSTVLESGIEVGSKLKGVGSTLLKGAGVAGGVLTAIDLANKAVDAYSIVTDENATAQEKSVAGAGVAGGLGGAAIGGIIGSFLMPGVGTALGAAVGEYFGSEGASSIAESMSESPEISDAIGKIVAVPMALVSEDARKALGQDIEDAADKIQVAVIDPIKKFPENVYNEIPDSVKTALGASVAVPMALVSEDARKALLDDWNNTIIPGFESSVVTPLMEFGTTFGEYFDKFSKSAELIGTGIGQAGLTLLGGIRGAFRRGSEALSSGEGIGGAASAAGSELGKSYEKAKGVVSEKFSQVYDTFKDKASVTIERYQKDLGVTREQAAAIVGNFGHESGGMQAGINEIKPLVKGSRGGYGWAQWTGPRRKALEAFAAERGMPVDSDETQYQFSVHELQTTHKKSLERLKNTNNLEDATREFFASYESGGDPRAVPAMGSRLKHAQMGYAASLKHSGGKETPVNVETNPVLSSLPSTMIDTATVNNVSQSTKETAGNIQNLNKALNNFASTQQTNLVQPISYNPTQNTFDAAGIQPISYTPNQAIPLPSNIQPNTLYKMSPEMSQQMYNQPSPSLKTAEYNTFREVPLVEQTSGVYGSISISANSVSVNGNIVGQQPIGVTPSTYNTIGNTTVKEEPSFFESIFSSEPTTNTTLGNTGQSYVINANSVSVNGSNISNHNTGQTAYGNQNIVPTFNGSNYSYNNASQNYTKEEPSFFGSLFNSSPSYNGGYSNYSYSSNPVDNAVNAVTNIPKSIVGGLLGGLMGNVSSAINAPQNIISGVTNSARSYAQNAIALPQNAMSNSISAVNNTVNTPFSMMNNAIGSARSMANNTVNVPFSAYNNANNALSSLYNMPNNLQSSIGGGYNYNNNQVLPSPTSLFSKASYDNTSDYSSAYTSPVTNGINNFRSDYVTSDYANVTQATPTMYPVERSQYEPISLQMPEINIPEPIAPPQEPNVRQASTVTNFDANRSSQTHRPSIDEIPVNISDSGLMLLNIGYI